MILTVCVLGTIAFQTAKALAITSVRFPFMSPVGAAGAGWQGASRLLWQTGFALLVLGGADYGLQRWRLDEVDQDERAGSPRRRAIDAKAARKPSSACARFSAT